VTPIPGFDKWWATVNTNGLPNVARYKVICKMAYYAGRKQGTAEIKPCEHAWITNDIGPTKCMKCGFKASRSWIGGSVRGPCAKKRVQCLIYPVGMAGIYGENDCANPQPTCPRLPGEDYTKCKTICQQAGHAEIVALRKAEEWTDRAGANLQGARAYIRGHYWMCEPCGKALKDAGIVKITIEEIGDAPPEAPSGS